MKKRKPLSEPRDTTVNIRVSQGEKEELRKRASAVGLSVGGYLLSLALGDSVDSSNIQQLPDPNQLFFKM